MDEDYRPAANPEWAKAMHEKGRSSATEPHADRRTRRRRSRAANKAADIRDQS